VSLKVLGVHVDGGMREAIVVPGAKLHRSDKLSLEQLALVETLGIGAHAVSRARLETEETVLVIGAGPIGLAVIQFAQAGEMGRTTAWRRPRNGKLVFPGDLFSCRINHPPPRLRSPHPSPAG
jgi:threonine dehydrogenase-like Zn-dependent dehydrogenase